MSRATGLRMLSTAFCLVAVSLSIGCTSTTGNPLAASPVNAPTKTAAAFRKAAASPQELPSELRKAWGDTYVVEPADQLRIETVDPESDAKLPLSDMQVMLDGRIDLGMYGRIKVAGLTLEEVDSAVTAAIVAKSKKAGEIVVRLVGTESKTFFVIGEVNAANEFPLTGRETVLQALLRAGGLTNAADSKRIVLVRPTLPCDGRHLLPVCYRDIVQLGDTSTNYQLQPGDRVFVPSRSPLEVLFPTFDRDKCGPCKGAQLLAPTTPLICEPACENGNCRLGVPE